MPTLARLLTALFRRTPPVGEPSSDAELLSRFATTRDATAFELLVWRHGAAVLAVCRRMLRHEQSAEDAFQATFLILARRAGSVRGQLAGWLHTTARRVCLRLAKRKPFAPLEEEPPTAVPRDATDPELAAVLDAEISRLPEKIRLAVILCYLQGLTAEQAGERLGIPRGTVLSRLANARKRLAERLTAKGITVPAVFLTTAAATELAAEVCTRTATAAVGFVTVPTPTTFPIQLATEVLSMSTRKAMIGAGLAAALLMAGVGTGLGWALADGEQKPAAQPAKPAAKAELPKSEPAKPKPADDADARKRFQEQREKLVAVIDDREKTVARLTVELQKRAAETGSDAERKANEELLTEVVRQVFAAETALMEAEFELKEAAQAYQPIRSRKADLEKAQAEFSDIAKKESTARDEYDKMAKVLVPDSPRLKEAKAALDALSEKRQEAFRRKDNLEQSGPRLPRGLRGGGMGGGGFTAPGEQAMKEYEQQLAAEEAKRAAVERGESAVRVKSAKYDFLRKRQAELKARLADAPAPSKLQELELEQRLTELRTLKKALLELELQLNGFGHADPRGEDKFDRILKLVEELRREVKELKDGKK